MLPDVPAMRTPHVENDANHQVNDDTDAHLTTDDVAIDGSAPDGPTLDESVLDEARLTAAGELGSQCTRFLRLLKRLAVYFAMSKEGIESAAYVLLARVVCDGAQRLTALADAVHADPSTVSRQTAALVRHGLLERRADPFDGRACVLAATERGHQVFVDNRRLRSRILSAVLADWSLADLNQLTVLLGRLNTDFETRGELTERTVEEFRTAERTR